MSGRALLVERPLGVPPGRRPARRGPLAWLARPWLRSPWLPGRWAVLAGLAGLLAVANLAAYNLTSGLESVAGAELRTGRYLDGQGFTPDAWGLRLLALVRSVALAVGSQVSEYVEPWGFLSPMVVGVGGLALLGLASFARRGWWPPALVVVSVLLVVSLLNARVEPVVPRARHYGPLIPLGLVAAAEGLVVLHGLAIAQLARHLDGARFARRGIVSRRVADVGLLLAVATILIGSVLSQCAYEDERLSRPDKNNRALLTVLDAVAATGRRNQRVYLDVRLAALRTMSGGRTLNHLRYAFHVEKQANTIVNLSEDRPPFAQAGEVPRRLILRTEDVESVQATYRLVPLPGEPGPDAPLRAFRAYPRDE